MIESTGTWIPLVFACLMAFSLLMYAVLDGYDLGVGMLLPNDSVEERDMMIASIGPFWDANETWLVLAVGLLLVAFPTAHGLILTELYLPVLCMLVGLILRGVAFDFRAKAAVGHKNTWDKLFKLGSFLAAVSQGYMLGRYVMGFEMSLEAQLFAVLSGFCVAAAYAFIGAAWLVMKTEGQLQQKSAHWSRVCGWIAAFGILAVSLVNLIFSEAIAEKWLDMPQAILLLPIPLLCVVLFIIADRYLKGFPYPNDFGAKLPFYCALGIFFFTFQGLAYSFYPYIVPGELTLYEAAAASESLKILLIGTVFVFPTIIGYTIFAYRVFSGKVRELRYY